MGEEAPSKNAQVRQSSRADTSEHWSQGITLAQAINEHFLTIAVPRSCPMSFILLLAFLFLQDLIRVRSCPRARNNLLKFWAPAIFLLAIPASFMVWAVHQLQQLKEGRSLDSQ